LALGESLWFLSVYCNVENVGSDAEDFLSLSAWNLLSSSSLMMIVTMGMMTMMMLIVMGGN
jgi:hypothetical protein